MCSIWRKPAAPTGGRRWNHDGGMPVAAPSPSSATDGPTDGLPCGPP